ncbi:hypothetical protein CLDAP_22870 [Caldilinea aerophila DSM 14535 = NBRC 104270]|uniref:Uncharacterized protein n=1 Tax=Caldilinea aerophila (strain DSM 14535 / JCM 11387 / NBRC 104270 / STL-6-O1) TaxID=926550 RepID=I0I4Y9_CALAS|nr:hypothetical protein CLDAP_22870 [Caldilinea aerophila DSM 14535 = NBRC 104270]
MSVIVTDCIVLYIVLYISLLYPKSSNGYVTRRTFVVFFTIEYEYHNWMLAVKD